MNLLYHEKEEYVGVRLAAFGLVCENGCHGNRLTYGGSDNVSTPDLCVICLDSRANFMDCRLHRKPLGQIWYRWIGKCLRSTDLAGVRFHGWAVAMETGYKGQ